MLASSCKIVQDNHFLQESWKILQDNHLVLTRDATAGGNCKTCYCSCFLHGIPRQQFRFFEKIAFELQISNSFSQLQSLVTTKLNVFCGNCLQSSLCINSLYTIIVIASYKLKKIMTFFCSPLFLVMVCVCVFSDYTG